VVPVIQRLHVIRNSVIIRDAMARRIEYPSRVVTKVRLEDERIMGVMAVKRSVGRVKPMCR